MIVKIYTVYDSKGEAFLQPFYQQSKGHAVRSFTDSVNEPNHPFNKYPEDFTLFELGTFNDFNATFDLHSTPVSIGLAVEFKKA